MKRRKFLDQAGRVGAVLAVAPGLMTHTYKVEPEPERTFEEKIDILIAKWGPALNERGYTDKDLADNRRAAIEVKDEKVNRSKNILSENSRNLLKMLEDQKKVFAEKTTCFRKAGLAPFASRKNDKDGKKNAKR